MGKTVRRSKTRDRAADQAPELRKTTKQRRARDRALLRNIRRTTP